MDCAAHWNNCLWIDMSLYLYTSLIPSQPVFVLTQQCVLSGETVNTNFHSLWFDGRSNQWPTTLGMTGDQTNDLPHSGWRAIKPMTYHTRDDGRSNQWPTTLGMTGDQTNDLPHSGWRAIKPMTYHTRDKHDNHYTTNTVKITNDLPHLRQAW
jgi:hypothetical protein